MTVLVEPTPLPTGKLSVMVFEDDFPLNGEQDTGIVMAGITALGICHRTPAAGTYCLQVWVRNSGSAANYDAWSSATFTAQ